MSFPKILVVIAIVLFGVIGIAAVLKRGKASTQSSEVILTSDPVEIELEQEWRLMNATPIQNEKTSVASIPQEITVREAYIKEQPNEGISLQSTEDVQEPLPEANRISELFNKNGPVLPFIETITYKSRVPWLKGRPAWISDYANYYNTSRHFIARSLNGKPDYYKQDVADGDRFNVFKEGKNTSFYLLIDLSRCKMLFYGVDEDLDEKTLLRTYDVGLGRVDGSKASGLLTPLGKYSLGNKIAIYKPAVKGFHNGVQVEMIQIFGTRWIPFEKEIGETTAPAKGFGIHGTPWSPNLQTGALEPDQKSIGKYESDGCVRLATDDMEELFSIIITKPTIVELVKEFHSALLLGKRASRVN